MSLFPMVGEKVISLFLSSILDKVAPSPDSINTIFSSMETRLDHIKNAQEMQQAMWLKSSLTFLEMQEHDKAFDELVRSEASDKRNATAKLYLAILLGRKGKPELAKVKLNEVIEINPFIPLICIGEQDISNCLSESLHFPKAMKWTKKLNSECFRRESLAQNWLSDLLSENQGNIYSASLSGGKLVVSWKLHAPDRISSLEEADDLEQELSCFDPRTGTLEWSRGIQDQELIFATPHYVVTREKSGQFNFLNSSDGCYVSSMGQDYFYTIFFPMFDKISKSREYVKSNKKLRKRAWIVSDYEKKNKQNLNELNIFLKLISSGVDYSKNDLQEIELPYADAGISIELKNHWVKDVARSSRYTRKAVYFDAIFCDAFISCSSS